MLYKDIIEETTKTSDIFKILRNYYQFAPSESTFLKFSAIKRETTAGTLERPLHLYLRLRQFIRDNLLLSSGKIQHDGAVPSRDEVLSPTTERLIVLRWLEILHPCLPSHVAHVFAQDLQTKSLKDLQPRINEQIEDLLIQAQNKSEEVNISYAKVSNYTRGGSGPRIFSKFPGKNDVPYRSFRGSNSQGYQKIRPPEEDSSIRTNMFPSVRQKRVQHVDQLVNPSSVMIFKIVKRFHPAIKEIF